VTAPLGPVVVDELPWEPWTPDDVTSRLAGTDLTWAIAGGWAVDLFLGRVTREHEDLEIVVPAAEASRLMSEFEAPDWTWRVPSEGALDEPGPESLVRSHQTWLWSAAASAFVLDVFRNRHSEDLWICHREGGITAPWKDIVGRTSEGVPFLVPEVVLLHKAKHERTKDLADLDALLPVLDRDARERLHDWLGRAHPGHGWLERLEPRA
jgi:hypothetical protein